LPRGRIKQALPDEHVDLMPPTLRRIGASAMDWTGTNPLHFDRNRMGGDPALFDRGHKAMQAQILQAADDVRS
jgi:hypothetical protein